MNDASTCLAQLYDLASAQCEGILSVGQAAQLQELVIGSQKLRYHYIVYTYIHALAELGRCPLASEVDPRRTNTAEFPVERSSFNDPSSSPPSPFPTFLSTTFPSTLGYSSGWSVSYLVATVITGLGILGFWLMPVSRPEQVATHSTPPATERQLAPEALPASVGKITGMVGCKRPGDSRVSLGQKIDLASGLLEITYDTGAKVILQGPVTYEVEANGGYLAVGKLTGKLEKRGEGREERGEGAANHQIPNPRSQILNPSPLSPLLSPLFVIRTPAATVTDLGTEFGVEVTNDRQTRMRVFQGKVVVRTQASAASAMVSPREIELGEGESASVAPQGVMTRFTGAQSETAAKELHFVRQISRQTYETLDLADIVAGGDGTGKARNRGINPNTGKVQTSYDSFVGDGRYHRVPGLPMIDGVFIPHPANDGDPVQIDSVGHTFAGFPMTDNRSSGCIWAGGTVPLFTGAANVDPGNVVACKLDGVDYSAPDHSLLYMHANKGITFDLDAIRRASPGRDIVGFSASAGNTMPLDEVRCWDIWVIVDGQLQFRRKGVMPQRAFLVTVRLDGRSRFLTLASTDGGDSYVCDQVIFGDPRLMIQRHDE